MSSNKSDEGISNTGSNNSEDGSSYASFLRFLGGAGEPPKRPHITRNKLLMLENNANADYPTSVTFDARESAVPLAFPSEDELENGIKLSSRNYEVDDADDFLKTAFAHADADCNGQISTEELKSLLRELGLNMSDNDLDKWMEMIDTDNSGEVSFQEFISIFKREKENHILERILFETFQSYDADESGRIDYVELRLLMAQLGHDISDETAKAMILQVDHDGNGEIDFEEFVSMFKGVKLDNMGKFAHSTRIKSSSTPYGRQTSLNSILEESISLFDDARKLIPINRVFRFVMYVHSNRILVLLAAVHFVATMIIWCKFDFYCIMCLNIIVLKNKLRMHFSPFCLGQIA